MLDGQPHILKTSYSKNSIWEKYKIHWTLTIDFYWLDEIGAYNLKYSIKKTK